MYIITMDFSSSKLRSFSCVYTLYKSKGSPGRISELGIDKTDQLQHGLYRKDRGLMFSSCSPKQANLMRDLLHDLHVII